MIIRIKGCSEKVCIGTILLTLFVINIFAYFLLDLWSTGAIDNYNSHNGQETENQLKESEKKLQPVKLVEVQRQRFVSALEHSDTASSKAAKKILETAEYISEQYNVSSVAYEPVLQNVLNAFKLKNGAQLSLVQHWATGAEIIPNNATELGSVLTTLCSLKIIKADISKKGTQLKLHLTLDGGWNALFKPQWYKRDTVIDGPVYAGKDRHNGEVAAFHLSLLLGMRRVPLTVGRRIDLRREVMPVATPPLLNTFSQEGNNTCFFGVCHYCSPSDPVCARRDILEGALILWLPNKLKFARFNHPWQRSYKNHLLARWEIESNYCQTVKNMKAYSWSNSDRLLDLVDTSIFDFLIDNGDRHHYETPLHINPSRVFLFDNGKSFGDPNVDHLDILAPLYQCCMLRKKTWTRLFKFRGGVLGKSLADVMKYSHISPVLIREHLLALDRRLLFVFAAVQVCLRDNPDRSVLI